MFKKLSQNGLTVHLPINEINRIIFEELWKAQIKKDSKNYYVELINEMINQNSIEGVILEYTEIEMIIKQNDLDISIFDTTQSRIDSIVN